MLNPLTMKLEQFTRFVPSERLRLDELIGTTARYRRGEDIIASGTKADHIHLVIDGFAARSKVVRNGRRQLMAFLIPGDLCDVEVFVLEAMDHDIVAMTDTVCAHIPAAEMEQLLTESSNLTRAIWWSTMTDSAVLREWIVNQGLRDALARVAHLFCELLVRFRIVGMGRDNSVPFPLTQDELSDATGMTPVHVNRVLRQLRDDGMIELRGKVLKVLDFKRLSRAAQYEPAYLHLMKAEKAEPAVAERVGDLLPASGGGVTGKVREALMEPFR